jgi:ATP/maltotriose-dependent transcriptional regulator MalT
MRVHLASLIEGFAGTLTLAEELLGEPGLDPGIRRQLEPVYAVSLFYSGRIKQAYEVVSGIQVTVPIADQSDNLALAAWSIAGMESGEDWAALDEFMTRILSDGIRKGDHAAAGMGAVTLGGLRFLEGRFADASRWFAEAEVHLEQQDVFGVLAVSRANEVGVAYYCEEPERARVALARCHDALGGGEPLPNQAPFIARAEAWGALALGEDARAQELLLDAAQRIADVPVYAAQLAYEALRSGAQLLEVRPLVQAMYEYCDSRLVAAYAAHAEALAVGDAKRLLEVAAEMQDIRGFRYGMEAAAHAAGLFADEGRMDSARRAAALSEELYARGQGGRRPRIRGLDPSEVALTSREAQLAELAAQGLSNAEIADRLVLSVRTVESHIYRAMQKMGVGDRRELRRL